MPTQYTNHFSCRFGVVDDISRKSALWRLRVGGKNAKDVYLAPESAEDIIKVSLHESGDWKVAYVKDYAKTLQQFQIIGKHEVRVVQSRRPLLPMPGERGVRRGIRLYIPTAELSYSTKPWPDDAVIITAPKTNAVTVIDVYFTDSTSRFNQHEWPFELSLGAQRICTYQLEFGKGEHIWAIAFPWLAANEEIVNEIRWFNLQPDYHVRLEAGLPPADITPDRAFISGENQSGGWISLIDASAR
ncbi:MAG: hypothetical protein JST16_01945 [Bdellovibrionales bacterium]|nr:hypothetical protein [Bdellovibrionales bacterium]